MKKTTPLKLSKRLVQYSALSLAFAGLADANGQIVYINDGFPIGPNNLSVPIDLDDLTFPHDDNPDFILRHDGSSYGILKILPDVTGNAIIGTYGYRLTSFFGFRIVMSIPS